MEKKRPACVEQIPLVDWEKTLFLCPETGRGNGAGNRKLRKTIGGSSHSPRTAIRESQSYIREFIISPLSRPTPIWEEAGEKEK